MKRRFALQACAALGFAPMLQHASAQPNTVKILAGFAPGTGVVDAVARLLAEKMKGDYAPTIVVENRTGVGGQLAVVATKTGPHDGSVMLVAPMSNFSLHPHIYSKMGYDPFKDLIPVGNCATADLALAVGSAVPERITTVAQLLDWYRANPEKASFATGATGSKLHFAGMKLGLETGVKLTHVGYTNGGTALTDLAGGSVPAYIGTVASVLPFTNRIRVLATTGSKRSKFLPDVPTLVEQGYKSMVVTESVALYLPSGTPAPVVERAYAALTKALASPETVNTLSTAGVEVAPSNGAAVSATLNDEYAQWGALTKAIGFRQES